MDRLEKQRVLPSWGCSVAEEMGKRSSKLLRLFIFPLKQINFGDKKTAGSKFNIRAMIN